MSSNVRIVLLLFWAGELVTHSTPMQSSGPLVDVKAMYFKPVALPNATGAHQGTASFSIIRALLLQLETALNLSHVYFVAMAFQLFMVICLLQPIKPPRKTESTAAFVTIETYRQLYVEYDGLLLLMQL